MPLCAATAAVDDEQEDISATADAADARRASRTRVCKPLNTQQPRYRLSLVGVVVGLRHAPRGSAIRETRIC